MADCHIGGWRDPRMNELGLRSFKEAVRIALERKAQFILISGDLFNTSLPAIDRLKAVVRVLKGLAKNGIPVYIIAGSHDFSPTGKTMIDVLEEAGLVRNVVRGEVEDGVLRLRFTSDPSGAKITGMIGKKGTLERGYYEKLDRSSLESEEGFKIFMFHTALTEFKPAELEGMDSAPLSLLPKGFDYYAGGHVHYVFKTDEPGYGTIAYPGPVFPNNFAEMEKLKCGSFNMYEEGKVETVRIVLHPVVAVSMGCENMTPEEVDRKLSSLLEGKEVSGAIVLIRLAGRLAGGSTADLKLKSIFDRAYERGAYFVARNTTALTSPEFEEISVSEQSVEQLEAKLIREHLGQKELPGIEEEQATRSLLASLDSDKAEGETRETFERRLMTEAFKILNVEK